jgi:hypothetical protein
MHRHGSAEVGFVTCFHAAAVRRGAGQTLCPVLAPESETEQPCPPLHPSEIVLAARRRECARLPCSREVQDHLSLAQAVSGRAAVLLQASSEGWSLLVRAGRN